MDALSNLIKNHPFNGNDNEILSAYRSLSQKEWDFIIAEIGFDPREEDPEASEFDHAEFISCEVGDHLLDVIESSH